MRKISKITNVLIKFFTNYIRRENQMLFLKLLVNSEKLNIVDLLLIKTLKKYVYMINIQSNPEENRPTIISY